MTISDIEHLLAPERADGSFVYVYRTGILRPQMKVALRDSAHLKGVELLNCRPVELQSISLGATLFPGMYLCDWSDSDTSGVAVDAVVSALNSTEGEPIALFVQHGDKLLGEPLWQTVSKNLVSIEEQIIWAHNLDDALSFLQKQSDLRNAKRLEGQTSFRSYFYDLMQERRSIELPELMQEFDKAVLLYSDRASGIFSGKTISEGRETRAAVGSLLRAFIQTGKKSAFLNVMRFMDDQYRGGHSHLKLLLAVSRATLRLIERQAADQMSAGSGSGASFGKPNLLERSTIKLVVWTVTLLSWIERLHGLALHTSGDRPGADQFFVAIDQMGKEYVSRSRFEIDKDPLSGVWSHLREAIADRDLSDEVAEIRDRLIRELASVLGPHQPAEAHWITRLRVLIYDNEITAGTGPLPTMSAVAELRSLPTPSSFADVIGQDVVTRSLLARVKTDVQGAPIVLCGPTGVGKRTLARLYAKALMCEDLPETGLSCGCCHACNGFEQSGGFGLIELDVGAVTAVGDVREQLKNLKFTPFARHRVVIIHDLDRAPAIADSFLKTLEHDYVTTTFIITLNDLDILGSAAKSRCVFYKLKPLNLVEGQRLSETFLAALGFKWGSGEISDLIAASSGGLPKVIAASCRKVAEARPTTLEEVRKTLGLNWAEDTLSYLRFLLGAEHWHPSENMKPASDPADRARRIRVVLEALHRWDGSGKLGHPAFWHVELSAFSEITSLLEMLAERRGVDKRELLSELSLFWLANDHDDEFGFARAGTRSRRIAMGQLVTN